MNLSDYSWKVTDEEYYSPENDCMTYSAVSAYSRIGFDALSHLNDKKESESLLFGSVVDCMLTGGVFEDEYYVANYKEPTDKVKEIADFLLGEDIAGYFSDINVSIVSDALDSFGYNSNIKDVVKKYTKFKESAEGYYNAMKDSYGKKIVSADIYVDAKNTVDAIMSSAVRPLFVKNDDTYFQLNFRSLVNGIPYCCKPDIIHVDNEAKVIHIWDLKTTSKSVLQFHESYIKWRYMYQQYMYPIIVRNALIGTPYSDYDISWDGFCVISRGGDLPLMYSCDIFDKKFNLGENVQLIDGTEIKNPFDLGSEIYTYRYNESKYPSYIDPISVNSLNNQILKLLK